VLADYPYLEREDVLAALEYAAAVVDQRELLIEDWRIDYNTNRPHSSLNNRTPTEFATAWTTKHQPQPA